MYKLERDYPKRYLARYKDRHSTEDANVIQSTWELNEAELEELVEEFGPDAVTSKTVTISRGYNSTSTRWLVSVDEAAAIQFLISQCAFSAPEKSQVGNPKTIKELIAN